MTDETLPPSDADKFASGETHRLNDDVGHLPYDPPTPHDLAETFGSSEPPGELQEPPGVETDDSVSDPGFEPVAGDLQPVVALTGTGEPTGDPHPIDAEPPAHGAPPPETPDEAPERTEQDDALAHAARAIGDALEPRGPTGGAQEQSGGSGVPDPAPEIESVVPDLQQVVVLDTGEGVAVRPADPAPDAKSDEISLETPPGYAWPLPIRSWVRVPPSGKPVYVWGVAVGVGLAGLAIALALTVGRSHSKTPAAAATATPATVTEAAATPAPVTTRAAAAAPTPAETQPPASAPPAIGPIGAVYTHRPPPPKPTNCQLGCLPVKPVTVRYTTYTVQPHGRQGRALTYRWRNSNACGIFRAKGLSAVWSFPTPGSSCPKGAPPRGTITVVASDGTRTCTARYETGGAPGTGPEPVCTSG